MQPTGQQANRAERIIARCRRLAGFSEDPGSTRRTFLSHAMKECHHEITQWMESAGARVRPDAAGNLRGFRPAKGSDAPRLILGSHLDTVPKAGAYDGVLGVVLAISLLEALSDRELPFAIEVIGFSEEEGVRFGVPFIGSRALVGRLDDELLKRRDAHGISVRQAIENFGLNPQEIPQACLDADTVAYIEFHIEQGPVLEELGYPLGVVEAIAGQSRIEFTFVGRTNHAGTTPMHLRYDAVTAAAEWITAAERSIKAVPGAVGTVGKIDAIPGATNVIAGEVHLTLDLRHRSDDIRTNLVAELIGEAARVSGRRGLTLQHRVLLSQPAVPMDPFLINEIALAFRKTGCEPHRMVSGAGHDAMILAEKVPAGMIFLRTPGGISHDPAESVAAADVEKALECGLHLLEQLAVSPMFQKRTLGA
jgi:allantoate deiminase